MTQAEKASVEGIKAASNGLRRSIADELLDGTEDVSDATPKLLKFHGTYLQDDRDDRKARRIQAGSPQDESLGDFCHRMGDERLQAAAKTGAFRES